VAKLLVMPEYHNRTDTPQIGNAERQRLSPSSGLDDEAALFAAGYVLAYDRTSGATEICNPVQNDVLGFLCGQLWQAATHYEYLIPD